MDTIHWCELSICDLRLWVHLGCSEEERFHAQPIAVNIRLSFVSPPQGAKTDNLGDTVCYQRIVELSSLLVKDNKFNLIEHLAATIHDAIDQYLIKENCSYQHLTVSIHKISPPIPNLLGGVFFSYSGKKA